MAGFYFEKKRRPWLQKAKELVYEPMTRIGIGVLVAGTLFGGYGYSRNNAKEGQIPLAFSEIGHTTKVLEGAGKQVPPLTKFYSTTNDMVMKVFEANNLAVDASRFSLKPGAANYYFAGELENKMEPTLKVHTLIPAYAKEIPGQAQEALNSVHKLVEANQELPAVNAEFSSAWSASHKDVTHTEYWTTTECDIEGKHCESVEHSREVYDYTIHTYNYYSQHGEKAVRLLEGFLKKHPDLNVEEQLYLATMTHADNEYAIETSMRQLLQGKMPSMEQYLELANTWATGSTLTKHLPLIKSDHSSLVSIAPIWRAAAKTAKSTRYTTYSPSDSGPKEYQIARSALAYGESVENSSGKIIGGIRFAGQNSLELDAKIREFIGVALDNKAGNAGKLRNDVLTLSKTIYKKNFEAGFDVHPFKWLEVFLFALGGMIAGGAAGAGVDHYLQTRKRHERQHDWRAEVAVPERPLDNVVDASSRFNKEAAIEKQANDDQPQVQRHKKIPPLP